MDVALRGKNNTPYKKSKLKTSIDLTFTAKIVASRLANYTFQFDFLGFLPPIRHELFEGVASDILTNDFTSHTSSV